MRFEEELGYIVNPKIKAIAEQGVALIPDYFYHVSASSPGKYHPNYTLGDEGLYRHVKAAVKTARMLFGCESVFTFSPDEQDLIIASLILHDGWKQGIDGSSGYTLHEHPMIASEVLYECVRVNGGEEVYFLEAICANIESHMGQWNRDPYKKGNVVMPLPRTKMEKYVHLCDYIASRKPLEFNFSVEVK